MKKLKIKFLGELWSLKKIILDPIQQEYFEQIAARTNTPLHEALIDPFFYHKLRLKSIQSVDDLKAVETSGLMNTKMNQVEIWYGGEKIIKQKIDEINKETTLFPLLESKAETIFPSQGQGLYVERRELGNIGSFEIMTEMFDYKKLSFILYKYNNGILLKKAIKYNNQQLKFQKKETLITMTHSYIV